MSNSNDSNATIVITESSQALNVVTMPEHISLDKWADSGFEWQGVIAPQSFKRLAKLLSDGHTQSELQLDAKLYRRNNLLHLAFTLTGEVWLTCQRCLQPIAVELTDDYNIALVDNEAQVTMVDESQDYLVLDEIIDSQTIGNLLPFKNIVEDEILLKTPMAPKHDDCEMVMEQVGDIPEEKEENPFAALAALKGKL